MSRRHAPLLVLVLMGAALRVAYIARPIYTDEAFTYLYFIRNGLPDVLTNYLEPNNHVFQTIFAWASVTVFGNTPAALRVPALVSGVLLMPATYAAGVALYGRERAGLLAAAWVAACVPLVEYAVSARGYSFIALFFALHVVTAAYLLRDDAAHPRRAWAAYGLLAAFGLYAVPVMLYPLGAVSLWLAARLIWARRWPRLGAMAVTLGAAALLTVLLYTPIIVHDGLALITRNRFVLPLSRAEFTATLVAFPSDFVRYIGQGLPFPVALVLVALGALALMRPQGRGLVVATLVWLALMVAVQYVVPPIRTWIFLVVLVGLMFGAGVDWLLERVGRDGAGGVVALLIALVWGGWIVAADAMSHTVTYRRENDALAAAQYLAPRLGASDWVLLTNGAIHNYEYELDRQGADFTRVVLSMDTALAHETLDVGTLYVLTRVGDDYVADRLRESIGVDVEGGPFVLEPLVTLSHDEITVNRLVRDDS